MLRLQIKAIKATTELFQAPNILNCGADSECGESVNTNGPQGTVVCPVIFKFMMIQK